MLHCLRDSRGVANSWARDVRRPESVDTEHATMPRYSAGTISLLWLLHNVEIEALGRSTPVLRVRYEDFVAAPAATTRAMLDFAGVVAPADHVHDSFVELGPLHSCAGNPMRFRRGRVDLVADDRWRSTQPASRRRLVTSVTAPLLAHYGYRA